MTCWCDKVYSYLCNECRKQAVWDSINIGEKVWLTNYAGKLYANTISENDVIETVKENLCPSQVPNSIKRKVRAVTKQRQRTN